VEARDTTIMFIKLQAHAPEILRRCKMPILANAMTAKRAAGGQVQSGEQVESAGGGMRFLSYR
jgi:hypothetical protein